MANQIRSSPELAYGLFRGLLKGIVNTGQFTIVYEHPFAHASGFQVVLPSLVDGDVVFDVSRCHDIHKLTTWRRYFTFITTSV